jgi:hypothetical protein
MALNSTLDTAIQGQAIRVFTAVQIALPLTPSFAAYTINLIDGAGVVTFTPTGGVSTTFTGEDPTFGVLGTISGINEAIASEAPHLSITMLPPSEVAVGQLNQPLYQGAPVKVWFGLVNEVTGAVIGVPELLFSGRLDTAKTTSQQNSRMVELDVASVFERLFVASEGDRLTDRWHQNIRPGETGLSLNNDALTDPMWGAETASGAITVSQVNMLKWLAPGLSAQIQ